MRFSGSKMRQNNKTERLLLSSQYETALARSVRDLSNITKQIEAKNVDLVVLDQNIDTSSPT